MTGPDIQYLTNPIIVDGQVLVAISVGLFVAAAVMMVIRKCIKIGNRS